MSVIFFYVSILESLTASRHYYTGFTENLPGRLDHHNSGSVPHTAKCRPWQMKTAQAFTDRDRTSDFERYLKSGSGRVFAKKRL